MTVTSEEKAQHCEACGRKIEGKRFVWEPLPEEDWGLERREYQLCDDHFDDASWGNIGELVANRQRRLAEWAQSSPRQKEIDQTPLGAYRARATATESPQERPKKGEYRIVGYGTLSSSLVGVGYQYEIQVYKTLLWGILGWWEKVDAYSSRDQALRRMRTLVTDKGRAEHPISKPQIIATEDTIYAEAKHLSG